jgi:hypothetical protein
MGNNNVNHISFQIQYPVDTTEHKEIIPMHTFLCQLKRRWIEKTVYTRANKPFSVSVSEIPPFIAPSVASPQPINTEIENKSVYLKKDILGKSVNVLFYFYYPTLQC